MGRENHFSLAAIAQRGLVSFFHVIRVQMSRTAFGVIWYHDRSRLGRLVLPELEDDDGVRRCEPATRRAPLARLALGIVLLGDGRA